MTGATYTHKAFHKRAEAAEVHMQDNSSMVEALNIVAEELAHSGPKAVNRIFARLDGEDVGEREGPRPGR